MKAKGLLLAFGALAASVGLDSPSESVVQSSPKLPLTKQQKIKRIRSKAAKQARKKQRYK